jgi:hypothetical protein
MLISTSFYTAVIGLTKGGSQMKKLRFMRYLTYFTIIFTLLIVLSGAAFAAKPSPAEQGNQNRNMQEDSGNSYINEMNNTSDANISEASPERLSGNLSVKNQNRISEYKHERQKIEEELELQRKEYQQAKKDFLKVKNRIRAEELNPNSNEALDATKLYLNSSISYMIAHLSNVKNNMEYSNGNGTEKTITSIGEKIELLEAEKVKVANASSQKELAATVRSVRETWEDAQKISLGGSGQIVSEKVGEFLNKSETLSDILETRIENLNKTGADISDLRIKLASYRSYLKSAQYKKKDADSVYEDQNATRENLVEANNYLLQSISDINKANKLLKDIFEELKKHENPKNNEDEVESNPRTKLKNTENVNSKKTN